MRWIFALVLLLSPKRVLSSLSSRIITLTSTREYFLPCIANITSRHDHDDESDFLLLSEELEYTRLPSDEIIQSFRHPVVIQREKQFAGYFGYFLLFPTEEKSYESLINIIHLSVYNKFLIVWPYQNANTEAILTALVNQFWSFRLLNVVILTRASNTAIRVYGYNPFLQSHCHVPRLVLLDVWSVPRNKFLYNNELYTHYQAKSFNLNGCPLVGFAKTRPPDSLVRQVRTGWELGGVGGQLMKLLSNRFNFTPNIRVPKANVPVDKYGYDISSGIPELVTALLVNQSIDLAFGIYSHLIYFREGTEFPSTAVSECWCWAVPARLGETIPTWMYYTGEFNILVWFSIFLVYLASLLLVYLCTKMYEPDQVASHGPTFVALYTFSVLLGRPIPTRIPRLRMITTMIALYSVVISSAYISSMDSLLTVPWKRENMKTFQEILDANLRLEGPPQSGKLLELASANNNLTTQELSAKFRTYRDHFAEIIRRMQRERNVATFASCRFLQFYINEELNKSERNDIHLLPECVINAHTSPFLLKQGSPFSHAINWIVLVAVEAGLTQYWFEYSTPKAVPSPHSDDVHSLSTDKVTFVFVILFAGLSLSFLIFLAEVAWCRKSLKIYVSRVAA